MAKRRVITADINTDEAFNERLSLLGEHLFFRVLSVADDFGIVPLDHYKFSKLVTLREEVQGKVKELLSEIESCGLGKRFEYDGKPYWMFNPKSFDKWQAFVLNRRARSEYLNLKVDDCNGLRVDLFPAFIPTDKITDAAARQPKKKVVSSKKEVGSREGDVGGEIELPELAIPAEEPPDSGERNETAYKNTALAYWRRNRFNLLKPHEEVYFKAVWSKYGLDKLLWSMRQWLMGGYRDLNFIEQALDPSHSFTYDYKTKRAETVKTYQIQTPKPAILPPLVKPYA